jgi:hypothetical protein
MTSFFSEKFTGYGVDHTPGQEPYWLVRLALELVGISLRLAS